MTLQLFDTATRSLRELNPIIPGHVGIYLCGATVQGSPHIGHIRSALAFDVLIRWLRRSGYQVTYVRNVTDIDDKILSKSLQAGCPWWEHAARYEREFAQAYRDLGLVEPNYEPRATGHIGDQIALIERLLARGHAYVDGANVYFSVTSLPNYGSLTRQNLADLQTTEDDTQIDASTESGKRDSRDFALWKAAKASEPETASWDAPWGRGRPGWHLECSAMARRYLGESFDIHGGGLDLRFPHHENEQAQSHGAGWGFANLWMHNAWVVIKGEKMSKSLGNSVVVENLLRRLPAPVLRLALGTVHYRSTVEYSDQLLASAQVTWDRLLGFVTRASQLVGQVDIAEVAKVDLPADFVSAMDNDLNLSEAMAVIHAHLKAGNSALAAGKNQDVREELVLVRAMLEVLGLDPQAANWQMGVGASSQISADTNKANKALKVLVQAALQGRSAARQAKDWAQADSIRDTLAEAGVIVEDSAEGVRWHLQ